jgi:HEAT repeats
MELKTLSDTPPWQWPGSAWKVFYDVLTDRGAKESDRLRAAELASENVAINDELCGALLAIVRSDAESEKLRGRAAISLGPVLELASWEELEDSDAEAIFDDPDAVPISGAMFREIQDSLRKLYADSRIPKYVRRRILEASVRCQQDWHPSAIKAAYESGDSEWKLTAVFCMCYVRGFEDQILEALKSTNPDIHYEAVEAAGNWEMDEAWPHVIGLIQNPATPKPLLLAAIESAGNIRPQEAGEVLADLADSEDEEIAETAEEAIETATARSAEPEEDEDEDDEDEWIN